ncbi:MAG TPA: PQQ-binding-like beta-propeller repeat protein [Gammaproteobacteria bacterium]|nr:PQQ-binding-like beta-propeller repeat protein [Gammaproteobacteria bacterium]
MRRCLTICLLAMTFLSTANAADVPAEWRRDFAEPIAWQRVTALGDLLVGTTGALYAVDPATGDIRWSHRELADTTGAGVVELSGSSLVLVTSEGENPRTAVVNMRNGALVFDSRKEQLARIGAAHVLARSGGLLIAGFEAGKPRPTLFLYNVADGKRLWSSDALSEGMSPLTQLVVSAALAVADVSPVQSAPLELDDGSFVLGAMGNLYRFEHATGKALWKTAYTGGSFELVQTPQRPDVLYVGAEETERSLGGADQARATTSTSYQAFSLTDGKPLWKRPMQFRNPMNREIVAVQRGLLVNDGNRSKGRLYLLDYDTGQSLWGNKGRGIDVSGLVVDHAITDAGLLITTGYDSVWTNKDTEYLVYVLDTSTGAFRFPEPLKVKGRLLTTELTSKGLLYVTTHELNVFDPVSGKLLNGPLLRGKQPIVTTTSDERFVFAYNSDDGFLYRFNRESGQIVKLSQTPFMLDEHDQARSLDALDGRLVLIGQQSVAGFSRVGALQFSAHYRAPRDPAWLRGLAWAEGIRAGMASAYAGAYSAAFASAAANSEQGSLNESVAQGLEKGFSDLQQGYQGLAGDYVSFARKRYQASAEARDFVFMMVQGDDDRVSLAQVSKLDGKIVGQIPMRDDKEPSYEVDDVGSLIFHHPAPTTVTAYRFSPQRVQVAEAPSR